MVKGYSDYSIEHSKRDADKAANDLRKLGYGARVVPRSRWKGRGRTTDAYRLKPDAQRYADELNVYYPGREARVVPAKKGTYDRTV